MTEVQTREHPILFKGEMVRAILDGRKHQTRRVVKPQPQFDKAPMAVSGEEPLWILPDDSTIRCPYGQPGDELWVRETWGRVQVTEILSGRRSAEVVYRAGPHPFDRDTPHMWTPGHDKWKPSIHMRREHSRIQLEVTGVRVERVQEISYEDAIAEGIERHDDDGATYYGPYGEGHADPIHEFRRLWNEINADRGYGWDENPWVWVIEFRRIRP